MPQQHEENLPWPIALRSEFEQLVPRGAAYDRPLLESLIMDATSDSLVLLFTDHWGRRIGGTCRGRHLLGRRGSSRRRDEPRRRSRGPSCT